VRDDKICGYREYLGSDGKSNSVIKINKTYSSCGIGIPDRFPYIGMLRTPILQDMLYMNRVSVFIWGAGKYKIYIHTTRYTHY
jgi:hypothetical protein